MAILSCFIPWRSTKSSSSDRKAFAMKRLRKELKDLNNNPPTHCSCAPVGDDIFRWQGAIIGPSDTPFEDAVFFLSIHFPDDYPIKPPKIKFQTKVYHPNIDQDGTIHVDILGKQWSPAVDIGNMLLSVCPFLPDPNPEYPLNPICNLYRKDRKAYNQKAREWTIKYAMG